MSLKYGCLNDYFEGLGYKRLKPVEVDPQKSNEHEFNGINKFKELFGKDKQIFSTRMIYLADNEDDILEDDTELTWYNAREAHPTRTEFRLYYKNSLCINKAKPEDFMILCRNKVRHGEQPSLTVFIAKRGDTVEQQLAWLFGISLDSVTAQGKLQVEPQVNIDYFTSLILEKIGVEVQDSDDALLEKLLKRFGAKFPSTKEFSEFARSIVPGVDYRDADVAIVTWMDSEEHAFRILENHIVSQKIEQQFVSVDDFLKFSLSVQNRRKSRAGFALENHLKYLFTTLEIKYDFNRETENHSRPDFIFPSIKAYHDQTFPTASLTMLGVKTTCKERWRQVLPEANRIEEKYLLTLEPGIASNQTKQMVCEKLRLVVPAQIFCSYTPLQQNWLLNISSFIDLVRSRDNG